MTEAFVIGPGVAQAIADAGDEARSDEQYMIFREGHKVSRTFGRDAVWFYLEQDNAVRRIGFEVATAPGPPSSGISWNPWADCPGQWYDWSCSACATEWTERAAGAARSGDIYWNREQVVYAIGYPNNISPSVGLHDGSGAQLQRVLREHAGLETQHDWLGFDEAMDIYSQTFGLMSGASWYHWVGVRGVQGDSLWLANSAEGYRGVYSTMNRQQYQSLGGFSNLWVPQ